MQVVYTVQVHIFSVPGKQCLPHAKVEVSSVHPGNAQSLLCQTVEDGGQLVDIPFIQIRVH